jgi:carbon monoxide dehydrogenase subunit G
MKMASEQAISAPLQRVWEALNDPQTLQASIPGCQSLEKDGDAGFTATVEVKVGPIGARFKGAVSLTDLDPPNGYTLNFQGNGGIAGSAKGSAKLRLRADGGATLISYEADAQVGGRMSQLGGPIIDATAKQLAGKFFKRFGEIVGGAKSAEATSAELATASNTVTGPAAGSAIRPGASSAGMPIAWVLAIVVGTLAGYLVGRGGSGAGSEWAGLAIGLALIVVASAAFEYGRRSATSIVMLDSAVLRRALEGAKE